MFPFIFSFVMSGVVVGTFKPTRLKLMFWLSLVLETNPAAGPVGIDSKVMHDKLVLLLKLCGVFPSL